MSVVLVTKTCGQQDFYLFAYEFGTPVPEQLFCLRIDQGNLSVGIDDDHGVGRRLHQSAEFLFRVAAEADVPYRANYKQLPFSAERAEADLNRELSAVFPERKELQSLAHGSNPRVGKKEVR